MTSRTDLHTLGVADASRALASGACSSTELVTHLLARIDAHAHLGAFLHVDAEGAVRAAREADTRRAAGQAGEFSSLTKCSGTFFVTLVVASTRWKSMCSTIGRNACIW